MAVAPESVPEVPARLRFAGQTGEAWARVIERTPRWRRAHAARELLLWLLAPLVFLLPPHVPWVLLVLGLGAFRAFNRLRERRTLVSLRGVCPKCGTEQEFGELGRMREPHTVACASCRWELAADVAPGAAAT